LSSQRLGALSQGGLRMEIGDIKKATGALLGKMRLTHQFVALLGPPWNTLPFFQLNSHAWLSVRLDPPRSAVSIGLTRAPGSSCHPVAGDQISPFLPPLPPLQEPPMMNTLPSESVAEGLVPPGDLHRRTSHPGVVCRIVGACFRAVVPTCAEQTPELNAREHGCSV